MIEKWLVEPLKQIAEHQPLSAGNLIHKQAKDELMNRKWIMYFVDEDLCLEGYCITELGKTVYRDYWNMINGKQNG
jgi:hypothetical protein